MCGRYQLNFDDPDKFKNRFDIGGEFPKSKISSNYNVAPTQIMPVVITRSPNSVVLMRWGLIPFWEKSDNPKGLFNIRDDTAIEKKWAHKYLTMQRCIVPASSFYEWQETPDGKNPYRIFLKNEDYMALAGIYSTWQNPKTGNEISSYAIITTSPNNLMKTIHNRMPVILEKDEEEKWLNPDMVEVEQIKEFLDPLSAKIMEAYPISKKVNSPSNNFKEITEPLSPSIQITD